MQFTQKPKCLGKTITKSYQDLVTQQSLMRNVTKSSNFCQKISKNLKKNEGVSIISPVAFMNEIFISFLHIFENTHKQTSGKLWELRPRLQRTPDQIWKHAIKLPHCK